MPTVTERDSASFTGSLRHKASASSDHGRALIPMWDSSDPERAPPPLPMNPKPQSPGMISRAGTSSAIQSAHLALSEKAREASMPVTSNMSRRADMPENVHPPGTRPLPIPGASPGNRRMQNLQPNVRDRSLFLEGMPPSRSPEKNLRPVTPTANHADYSTGSPGPGPSLTPIIRPVARRTHQSILGENTPPQSATMMALNTMPPNHEAMPKHTESQPTPPQESSIHPPPASSPPKEHVKGAENQSQASGSASTPAKMTTDKEATPKTKSAEPAKSESDSDVFTGPSEIPPGKTIALTELGHHILDLTKIASQLQKDMAALSRRSRDNAADLLSLKQATNARDEDIRKGLRNLIENVDEVRRAGHSTKDVFANAGLLLDAKPHQSSSPPSTNGVRAFNLPRIPTPNSFAASLDRESVSTPSLYGQDAPQIVALLERIVRDMGTKEGHENVLARLSELAKDLQGLPSAAKVTELIDQLRNSKSDHGSRYPNKPASESGSVRSRIMTFEEDSSRHGSHNVHNDSSLPPRPASSAAGSAVTDDVLKVIHSVKDSVAQGGGLTAEVKALVRELRGEILGMGRELGRRLDELEIKDQGQLDAVGREKETNRIINESLEELRDQMDILLRSGRRGSTTSAEGSVDYQEIYNALRVALKDSAKASPPLSQDDVIVAVRDAWENYKPDIEIQQYGLERDEVLACLKQGLETHNHQGTGISQEQVFQAVVDGLKHYNPPRIESAASLSRDEILDAVRECLEEFEFPVAPGALGNDMTRNDIAEAVRAGLRDIDLGSSTIVSTTSTSATLNNTDIMNKLSEIMDMIRSEFTSASVEAKQSIATAGRDSENIIDSTRTGFEKLRFDIETYVDRLSTSISSGGNRGTSNVSDATVAIGGLARALDDFRDEINDMLRSQTETLRDTVNMSLIPASSASPGAAGTSREVLEALRDGVETICAEIRRPLPGTTEVLDALHEGLGDLHLAIDRVSNKPADLTANDEILNALKAGLDSVRMEINDLRHTNNRALVSSSARSIHSDTGEQPYKPEDIRNLEFLVSQVHDRLDKISSLPPQAASKNSNVSMEGVARSDDVRHLELLMSDLHTKIEELTEAHLNAPVPDPQEIPLPDDNNVKQEDIQNLELLVSQMHEKLEKLAENQANAAIVPANGTTTREAHEVPLPDDHLKQEDIQNLQFLITKLHDKVEASSASSGESSGEKSVSSEDLERFTTAMETLKETVQGMAVQGESLKETVQGLATRSKESSSSEPSVREDIQAIETILVNAKASIDDFVGSEKTVRKEHIDNLEMLLLETRQSLSTLATQMESVSRREDVYTLQALISQMSARHDQAKLAADGSSETVPAVATSPEPSFPHSGFAMPMSSSRDDITTLSDSLKTSMSVLAESHSMSVVNRQTEIATSAKNFADIKSQVEDLRNGVTSKLEDGFSVVQTVSAEVEKLVTIAETNEGVSEKLRELTGNVKADFEETRASFVGAKLDSEEKMQQASDALSAKIDSLQTTSDEKAVELKTHIEQLEKTVTDSIKEVDEASKTVFNRVEDLIARSDEDRVEIKAQHELTREELKTAIDGVKEPMAELQPLVAVAMKEVLDKVVEHYDHSQDSTKTMQARIDEIFNKPDPVIPDPYNDTELQAKIDAIATTEADALAKLASLVDEETGALTKLTKMEETGQETHKRLDVITVQGEEIREKLTKGVDSIEEVKTAMEKLSGETMTEVTTKLTTMDEAIVKKLDSLADCDLLMQDKLEKVETGLNEKLEALSKLEKLETLEQGVSDKLSGFETTVTEKMGAIETTVSEKLGGMDTSLTERIATMDTLVSGGITNLSKTVDDKLGELSTTFDSAVTGKISEVETKLGEMSDKIGSVDSAVNERLTAMDASLGGKMTSVDGKMTSLEAVVVEKTTSMESSVTENFATMHSTITESFSKADTALTENFATLNSQVSDKFSGLETSVNGIGEQVKTIDTSVVEKLASVETKLGSVETVTEKLAGVETSLTEQFATLDKTFEDKLTSFDSGLTEKLVGMDDSLSGKITAMGSTVTEKLDLLVENDSTSLARLETLDKMHQQVMQTAADISNFLAAQTQRSNEEQEKADKSLEEAAASLTARNTEREVVAASIAALREEETRLRDSVITLRADQELMSRQRSKLAGDVSSLETALNLRREELREMENRAEGLERRIMEGVMAHSRILLMSRSAGNGKDAMSRKRVRNKTSQRQARDAASTDDAGSRSSGSRSSGSQKLAQPANIALSSKRRACPSSSQTTDASRRIASLSQIGNSTPLGGMKRSHSVRSNIGGSASNTKSAQKGGSTAASGKKGSKTGSSKKGAAAAASVAAATVVAATAAAVSTKSEAKDISEVPEEDEETDEEEEVEVEEVEGDQTTLHKELESEDDDSEEEVEVEVEVEEDVEEEEEEKESVKKSKVKAVPEEEEEESESEEEVEVEVEVEEEEEDEEEDEEEEKAVDESMVSTPDGEVEVSTR
ncbi:hypothetical protein BROUX41_006744 [Berkeleyomyces rouxiae]|uniref:uncharacterized protein n=1 Tax=Berkeleyomyces rouxiae TaxID=2035830 RepID=UPI003B7DF8FE